MLTHRFATEQDVDLFFKWANDSVTRENSYQQLQISYNDHVNWFKQGISNIHCSFYLFKNEEDIPIGQVRIDITDSQTALISISVDVEHRKKGYAAKIIRIASDDFLLKNKGYTIIAYIFKINQSSYHSFLKAGFFNLREETIKTIPSYILYKA
ncbi:GNAT family N-acetyltransferase [Pedobacter cryoconitis]|uniref:Spore coat polysaccharide biosynthesis protein SpsF n=1 Tax=Pedobacter cryoconitis TaxID=188932 RepID=A0A327SYZ9_9SPHI|nr:GNAT family N-acetyltransferase [Pedobacter cryoconitis]RAJ33475.1 spore coat polysaccharide biosynthesis protein SpsF [Pedobacter cryoconitis]